MKDHNEVYCATVSLTHLRNEIRELIRKKQIKYPNDEYLYPFMGKNIMNPNFTPINKAYLIRLEKQEKATTTKDGGLKGVPLKKL